MSPLSLASIVTLSGSHVFTGATVAVSGLESEMAVAMVVAGRRDPTLAALRDTDWMCAPVSCGRRVDRFQTTLYAEGTAS